MTFFPFHPPEKPPELHAGFVTFNPGSATPGFSAEECRRIIALALSRSSTPAEVFEGDLANPRRQRNESIRHARITPLPTGRSSQWLLDRLFVMIATANARFWNFDLAGIFSPLVVVEYGLGGHYVWHTDLGAGPTSNRKVSLTVQLSDPNTYRGGELELRTSARGCIMPREQGSMILFPSYTLHRVRRVTRGKRLALVGWVQGVPFR